MRRRRGGGGGGGGTDTQRPWHMRTPSARICKLVSRAASEQRVGSVDKAMRCCKGGQHLAQGSGPRAHQGSELKAVEEGRRRRRGAFEPAERYAPVPASVASFISTLQSRHGGNSARFAETDHGRLKEAPPAMTATATATANIARNESSVRPLTCRPGIWTGSCCSWA